MKIGVLKETFPGERRVPMTPAIIEKLTKGGVKITLETGVGLTCRYADSDYEKAGALIEKDRESLIRSSDLLMRLRKPPIEEIAMMKKGSIHISYLDPFNEAALLDQFCQSGVGAISLEMIPRSTIAQKMDVLSSQANLAGYVAVILAAEKLDQIFPMMTTPAGTIKPTRVFIVGAGVAGLQAIATAKRLGARVEAFDTRPVVAEQVQSLGAKFVKIDLGETGQTKDGYAKALTPEQIKLQQDGMAKVCSQSDVVITTAQLFGRKAPVIITADMVHGMKPGSVIVDMAVESGGNVEGSELDKTVEVNGVSIIGLGNLPGHAALPASQMYASNLANLILHFWDKETSTFNLNLEDDIIKNSLITYQGAIFSEAFKKIVNK